MSRYRLPPIHVFITMTVIGEMAFMTFATVSSVYRINEADLNPLQLILVDTVLELSVFIARLPTGVIAGVYSRRLPFLSDSAWSDSPSASSSTSFTASTSHSPPLVTDAGSRH